MIRANAVFRSMVRIRLASGMDSHAIMPVHIESDYTLSAVLSVDGIPRVMQVGSVCILHGVIAVWNES
jgi:hypothetical protein